jgi:two-component system nitrate/nitrite response regulator NarL
VSILIVDDHPLVRRGIIDILSINKTGEDIRESSNIEEALKILKMNLVNIIVLDLHLGSENGFDLIDKARKINQKVKFVILTSSSNLLDFSKAKELNVDGYILKDAFVEDIIYALSVIRRGGKFYSGDLVEKTLNGFEPIELHVLTEREKEVFSLLSKGLTNAQISSKLYISEGTTKKHISSILSKLNLNNRIEVILYAEKLYGSGWEVSNAI